MKTTFHPPGNCAFLAIDSTRMRDMIAKCSFSVTGTWTSVVIMTFPSEPQISHASVADARARKVSGFRPSIPHTGFAIGPVAERGIR